jgi:hypothetical protein
MNLQDINTTLFARLKLIKACPVYDSVMPNKKRPYIALGETTSLPWDTKTSKGYEVSCEVLVYSDYKGDKEVNLIADELYELFKDKLVLPEGMKVIKQSIEEGSVDRLEDYRECVFNIRLLIFKEE